MHKYFALYSTDLKLEKGLFSSILTDNFGRYRNI